MSDGYVQKSVALRPGEWEIVAALAHREGISVAAWARRAVRVELARVTGGGHAADPDTPSPSGD